MSRESVRAACREAARRKRVGCGALFPSAPWYQRRRWLSGSLAFASLRSGGLADTKGAYYSSIYRGRKPMHDPTDLLTSAAWVLSAEKTDKVRRALRAHHLGLGLEGPDRESLEEGAQFLRRALRAATARTPEERASASFSADADALRMLNDTVRGISVDRAKVENLQKTLTELAHGRDADASSVKEAIELFARITRMALDRLRALQETAAPIDAEG